MSLQSWKAEFYPVEAKDVPEEEAIQHSLTKWRGLTKENLEKHGLRVSGVIGEIFEAPTEEQPDTEESLRLDSTSCALCHHYLETSGVEPADGDDDYENEIMECFDCPLRKHLGYACDKDSTMPYQIWTARRNPLPMIQALEATLANQG